LSGTLKAAFWGAVTGAVTYGIGECFTATVNGVKAATAFSKTFGGVMVKAAAHGISQGTLAMMQNDGAGFLSGAAGGFFGSLGATAWGGAGGEWKGIGGKYAGSSVGTIAFGALSGGVGAELSGGNFWQGAIAGGIVAGLNDVMHNVANKIQTRQNLRELLISKGYLNPDQAASYSDTDLVAFARKVFPEMFSAAGNPKIGKQVSTIVNGVEVDGFVSYKYNINKDGTVGKLTSLELTITKGAFSSYLDLAQTIGHELNHYIDHFSGCYAGWANSRGGNLKYAHAVSEVNAWNWSHNWNKNIGTFIGMSHYTELLGTFK
jgi:hypothetical protein